MRKSASAGGCRPKPFLTVPELHQIWKNKLDPDQLATEGSSMLGMGRFKKLDFQERGKGAVVRKKDDSFPREPREVTISQAKRFQRLFTGSPAPDPARQASTQKLLTRMASFHGSSLPKDSEGNPRMHGPRIRYQIPVFFKLPDPEPVTKPVHFHNDRRFEDPRKQFKDPGQEKLCSTLDVDERSWKKMSAYITPSKKSFRRTPMRKDDPPHCYLTMAHKAIPFEDTKLIAYSQVFNSKQGRLGKLVGTVLETPGPGSYKHAQDSCHIKDPEMQYSSFLSKTKRSFEKHASPDFRAIGDGEEDLQETFRAIAARKRHMELPFTKRRFRRAPQQTNKNLGPGEYKGVSKGWEFTRNRMSRHVSFSKAGLNQLGNNKKQTEELIATIKKETMQPRKHKWPREKFTLNGNIVQMNEEFWRVEREQNSGLGGDDSDDEEY